MSFFVNSGYEDMTLEDFTDINDNPNAVKKNINEIDWIRTEKKSEYDEEISYMYYAKYDNKFYGVFYSLSSSIDDSCLESLEVIEKSLKFED